MKKALDKDHLNCPYCLGLTPPRDGRPFSVTITDGSTLMKRHFGRGLPSRVKCKKCGAQGKKVAGCCRLRFEWKRWRSDKDYLSADVAKFVCSDCKHTYYAKIDKRGSSFEIGEKVPRPPKGVKVRVQRMLCGKCRGKGGPGDRLQNILERQRGGFGEMGRGNDPFGLF